MDDAEFKRVWEGAYRMGYQHGYGDGKIAVIDAVAAAEKTGSIGDALIKIAKENYDA